MTDSDDVTRLQQILASDRAALSLRELEERSRDEPDEIEAHLEHLTDRGLVEPVSTGECICYQITDDGAEWLQTRGLYEQAGILYDAYRAADAPDRDCADLDDWHPPSE